MYKRYAESHNESMWILDCMCGHGQAIIDQLIKDVPTQPDC